MDVSISARHVNITPRLEEVIHEKIGGLDKFLQGLDHAEVHFDEARNPRITDKEFCEVVVEGHGHHLRCKVHAPDPFSAVDAATLKLERQIRKLRTRLQRRQRGSGRRCATWMRRRSNQSPVRWRSTIQPNSKPTTIGFRSSSRASASIWRP